MKRFGAMALLTLALLGCDERTQNPATGKTVVELWHSQKRQNEDALKAVVARFNAQSPTYEVKLANFADYTALFRKLRLAAQGGVLPDLGIAYESMVVELMQIDVVEPLDPYFNHPDYGLTQADQDDIFPSFLHSNRYPEYGGKLLSFPFTKSLLILYYNQDLLRAAGHEAPPTTWKQFVQQCRDVKARTGKTPFAYSRDASSFDGMVLSYGGVLAPDKGARSGFDSPETLKVLELLHTLASQGLARVIPLKSDDDRLLFSNQECAFILRSSTTRSYMRKDLVDKQGKDRFAWSCACPPVGEGQPKLTVLYGGNIVMFKSTPERQRGAWEFIKFFVSPEVTAEWAMTTGYLPVRKSAAELPDLKASLGEHPRNRAIFDTIPFGVREPSVAGWQRVRDDIAKAITRVVERRATPAEAAAELTKDADAALGKHQRK